MWYKGEVETSRKWVENAIDRQVERNFNNLENIRSYPIELEIPKIGPEIKEKKRVKN